MTILTLYRRILRKLSGHRRNEEDWLEALRADGVQQIPIQWHHAERVRALPDIHRDPFDRILITQAIEEHLVLVTADETIQKYPVQCLAN
ncbi:MAG: PIN domain-containing protein [Spirochaetaceae bacterium]|nr:MAG: PIN domain-containing protein [Spirochaetaceae bacterium]